MSAWGSAQDSVFFEKQFRMELYLGEIDGVSRGIVKDRNLLYWDQFKQMRSIAPPPDEQAAIVRLKPTSASSLPAVCVESSPSTMASFSRNTD